MEERGLVVDDPHSAQRRQQLKSDRRAPGGVLSAPAAVVAVIGFACFLTAGMVELNPSMAFASPGQTSGLFESLALPRLCVTVVGLVAVFFLSLKKGTLYNRPALVFGLGATYALGILLTYTCGYGPLDFAPGAVAGSLLTAASILILPLWFEVLCCENTGRVVLYTAGAYALSNAMTLVVTDLSFPAFVATTTALPLAASALLFALRDELDTAGQPAAAPAPAPTIQTVKQVPLKAFLGTAIFGASILMANSISEQRYSFSTETYTVVAGLAVALAVTIVALVALNVRRRLDFTLLYRLLLPVLVTCLLLVMIAESGFQTYEALALGGTWTFYRIVTAAVWCSATADTMLPPAATVSVAQLIQSVLNKIEGPVLSLIPTFGHADTVTIAAVVSLVVFASMFLFNEHTLHLKVGAHDLESTPYQNPQDFYAGCVAAAAEKFALSQREQELCLMVLDGMSSDEIRSKLVIAPGTFKTHMRNIYAKVDVHSRTELVELLHGLA